MDVSAELSFQQTKLIMQQSTMCSAALINTGFTPLFDINPRNVGGTPTLLVTNVQTGVTTRAASLKSAEVLPSDRRDLATGDTLRDTFFLSARMEFPEPGEYDVVAHYSWGDDAAQVESPPVRVEVLPATPQNWHIVPSAGIPGLEYLAAWVNKVQSGKKTTYQVWLAEILMYGQPVVQNMLHIADLNDAHSVFLSVPPGQPPSVNWIGWIDGSKHAYAMRRGFDVSVPDTVDLPEEDFAIVPPLLTYGPDAQSPKPVLNTLLYRPGPPGQFLVARPTEGKQDDRRDGPVDVRSLTDPWARTAFFGDMRRLTFVILRESGACDLAISEWSGAAPPRPLRTVHTFSGRFVDADLVQLPGDRIFGATLTDGGQGLVERYKFNRWQLQRNQEFKLGESTAISLPTGRRIAFARCRVDVNGQPYALVRTDDDRSSWYLCKPNGVATYLSKLQDKLAPPVDIIFRDGSNPVLVHTADGCGFQFAQPQ
jgi:hypothetical protein